MTIKEAVEVLKVARAEAEWESPMDVAAALDVAIKVMDRGYAAQWRMKAEHRCVECGEQLPEGWSKFRCEMCLKFGRMKTQSFRDKMKELKLCCDCRKPTNGGHIYCDDCLRKRKEYNRMYFARKKGEVK